MVEHEELEIKTEGAVVGYVLEAHLTVIADDNPEDAFGELVDVIAAWSAERGELAVGLAVVLIAPSSLHEQLLTYAISLIQEYEPLRPFFQQIGNVALHLGESADGELQELCIESAPTEDEPNA
jgi:hypothetical protein